MIIRRKLFSKEEKQERSKSDITSDVTVVAGMGALIAGSGRLSYEKAFNPQKEVTEDSIKKLYRKKSNRDTDKLKMKHRYSNAKQAVKDIVTGKKSNLIEKTKRNEHQSKEIGLKFLDNKKKFLDKPLQELNETVKSGKKLYKPVKKVGKYAAIGAGIGAVYGLGNNLKKQRDKIEDAAGDRVAEVIRGIGKKGRAINLSRVGGKSSELKTFKITRITPNKDSKYNYTIRNSN